MSTFLRLGEAARQLGVSVDTVRRYVEEGRLPAFRTPGGQMQVRAEDISALRGLGAVAPRKRAPRDSDEPDDEPASPPPARAPEPRRPAWQELPPWEQRRAEFKADLEIEQIQHERGRIEAEAGRRAAEAQADAEEAERLRKLKRYGKQWCLDFTIEPTVVRKLDQFVTTERVPPWLTEFEQRHIVQQFVLGLVNRHAERQREESRRKTEEEVKRIRQGWGSRDDD
ncbi:MAG: excisionase family DNA-binding protein [Gemmatimonadales bacterium]